MKGTVIADPVILWLVDTNLDAANGYRPNMSTRHHGAPIAESQHHVIYPANSRRALDDGVEHRLHVGRRAADDSEHLGCGCLMLQSFAQFCIALLDLLEQTHVLDGDDRLVGESLEKGNLLLSEGFDFRAANSNGADRNALA